MYLETIKKNITYFFKNETLETIKKNITYFFKNETLETIKNNITYFFKNETDYDCDWTKDPTCSDPDDIWYKSVIPSSSFNFTEWWHKNNNKNEVNDSNWMKESWNFVANHYPWFIAGGIGGVLLICGTYKGVILANNYWNTSSTKEETPFLTNADSRSETPAPARISRGQRLLNKYGDSLERNELPTGVVPRVIPPTEWNSLIKEEIEESLNGSSKTTTPKTIYSSLK